MEVIEVEVAVRFLYGFGLCGRRMGTGTACTCLLAFKPFQKPKAKLSRAGKAIISQGMAFYERGEVLPVRAACGVGKKEARARRRRSSASVMAPKATGRCRAARSVGQR